MTTRTTVLIIDKGGSLKNIIVKDFKIEELYKKCGFKKPDNFIKQTEWKAKLNKIQYFVEVYAKEDGRANFENKYDFPPPLDNKLFFGSCAILAYNIVNNEKIYTDLSVEMWSKIYEVLFGGFEDLSSTAKEDEEEIDELKDVANEHKTKQGYLKDGFVIDSSDTEEMTLSDEDDVSDEDEKDEDEEDEGEIVDLGSELSVESYEEDSEYEDDKIDKNK
tara:strand:- start:1018 stop:1674 length:657 start_codon:yes stop_codon:yes gene_type:complete